MKKTIYFAFMSLALGSVSASAAEIDCVKLSVAVKHAVAAERASVLEVVTAQINANPGCACEIVKAAIEGTNADAATVATIVEAAVTAAPEQMRLISQCAVAVAPESLVNVQHVLAKLDPNKGEGTSAKSSKVAAPEVANAFNPLDFPAGEGQVNVGPRPGDSSRPFFPPGNDPNVPPIVNFPDPDDFDDVTDPNPQLPPPNDT
jgi:hypothetical protein